MKTYPPARAGRTPASRSFCASLLAFALLATQVVPVAAAPLVSTRDVRGALSGHTEPAQQTPRPVAPKVAPKLPAPVPAAPQAITVTATKTDNLTAAQTVAPG